MTTPLTPEAIETIARKRANAKMGWYIHACVFVLVNLFHIVRSEHGFGQGTWHYMPVLAWGFGLCMHGLSVFFLADGSGLRESLVQRERERLQRQQDGH
jgi:hypothetical protein